MKGFQAAIQFFFLSGGDFDRLRDCGNAIPNILDKKDTFVNIKLKNICNRNFFHALNVLVLTKTGKANGIAQNLQNRLHHQHNP